MARSMDMAVTDSLDCIIRLLESGPKLAQKYIHRPLTLRGKKIDLRFIVVLASVALIALNLKLLGVASEGLPIQDLLGEDGEPPIL